MDLYKPPRLYFYWLMLIFFRPLYKLYFKLKGKGLENIPKKGPFLAVANHSHLLDPFFIGAMIKRPVFQMASNEFFRNPLVKQFMWAMGAFPRKKGFVDFRSIKYAIKIVKKGYPLIIYPEGGRNWDGETLPILTSTAKLVKILNVPVIAVVSKGNYLAFPRWADKKRKNPITIYFSKPVHFEAKTSDRKIAEYIQEGIYNNDNYTKVKKIRGGGPARGLPRLLWRCPSCRSIDALTEKDRYHIFCTLCGKIWEVSLSCYMREHNRDSWVAVKEYSDRMLKPEEIVPLQEDAGNLHPDLELEQNEDVYLKSKKVTLFNQPRYPKLNRISRGTLYLTNRRLFFLPDEKSGLYSYPFKDIRGRSTERNYIFQIILDHDIARFEMPGESCYKWEVVYDHLRKTNS
ncbi:MAG: lysophospholipid acyltransferase family protein [Spirochaetota bacterium]